MIFAASRCLPQTQATAVARCCRGRDGWANLLRFFRAQVISDLQRMWRRRPYPTLVHLYLPPSPRAFALRRGTSDTFHPWGSGGVAYQGGVNELSSTHDPRHSVISSASHSSRRANSLCRTWRSLCRRRPGLCHAGSGQPGRALRAAASVCAANLCRTTLRGTGTGL